LFLIRQQQLHLKPSVVDLVLSPTLLLLHQLAVPSIGTVQLQEVLFYLLLRYWFQVQHIMLSRMADV
jgi:hypothetical protein